MAGMLKADGDVLAPNQLPPPQSSGPQLVQYLQTGPLNQSIAATLNQNNSGLQEMLKGKLKALGITQIVTGIIAIITGIVQISVPRMHSYLDMPVAIGTPWWTGVLFIIAGSLAVAVEKDPSHCMIRGCLSMNIISAISCLPAVIIYATNLDVRPYCYHSLHCVPPEITISCVAILLVLTLLNAAISIAVSSFNCKAVNGCCTTPVPIIVVYNNTSSQLTPQQQFYENPPPYNMTPMENVYVG
ncbi:membrane-spanning 4-domains subfamily A member 8-like [Mustelus asterias]